MADNDLLVELRGDGWSWTGNLVDSTLTKEGVAAEGKATGDAISTLKDTKAPGIEIEASGALVTVDDAAALHAAQLISHIEPVQAGEGDPSLENVRPIRGWDAAEVHCGGKNLIDFSRWKLVDITRGTAEWLDNGVKITATKADAFTGYSGATYKIKVVPGETYTLSWSSNNDTVEGKVWVFGYTSQHVDEATAYDKTFYTNHTNKSLTFTVPDGMYYVRFRVGVSVADTSITYTNIQLEPGSTATAYEPYQGQTLTADLPETVYAGVLDWKTGILTKYKRTVFDGVTTGQKMDTTDADNIDRKQYPYAYMRVYSAYFGDFILASNKLPIVKNSADHIGEAVMGDRAIAVKLSRERIGWEDGETRDSIVAKVNAVLNQWYQEGEPLEVVYIPPKPETIQLTPQQLDMLKGYNNVWSDTGDTDLVYIADTKIYIDKKFDALAAALLNV